MFVLQYNTINKNLGALNMENNNFLPDNSVFRKKKLLEKKENIQKINNFPVFTLVEFNIYGACNRSCNFCPVSDSTFYTNKYEGISTILYKKVILDLYKISYKGNLLFSAFSEPFLNMELEELVKITKKFLPNSRLEIVSNGDLIKNDHKRLLNLYSLGLDTVSISIYDGPDEFDNFISIRSKLQITDKQMVIKRRYYNKDNGDFGMIISNRTSLIDSNKFRSESDCCITDLPLNRVCYYPFYQTLIDYNGDMLLCPHDWKKSNIVGNLKTDNIWDLWIGNNYESARKKLTCKNRNFNPCNSCDVKGDIIGEINHSIWRKYHER